MANPKQDATLELLRIIDRIATKIGSNQLRAYLKNLDKNTVSLEQAKAEADTIRIVCDYFGLTLKQLKHNHLQTQEEKDKRYWAINYLIVIFFNYGGYNAQQIGNLFDLSKGRVWNRKHEFGKLDAGNKFDSAKLTDFEKIIQELTKKKIFANLKN